VLNLYVLPADFANFSTLLANVCTFYKLGLLKLLFKVLCLFWFKKNYFKPKIFCHYFHGKECFPLTHHINTNPHAHTLNFLSVRLFLCHTARNSRRRTMSKQLSNWMLLGNSPSFLFNDSGHWPDRRRVTHTHSQIIPKSAFTTTRILPIWPPTSQQAVPPNPLQMLSELKAYCLQQINVKCQEPSAAMHSVMLL